MPQPLVPDFRHDLHNLEEEEEARRRQDDNQRPPLAMLEARDARPLRLLVAVRGHGLAGDVGRERHHHDVNSKLEVECRLPEALPLPVQQREHPGVHQEVRPPLPHDAAQRRIPHDPLLRTPRRQREVGHGIVQQLQPREAEKARPHHVLGDDLHLERVQDHFGHALLARADGHEEQPARELLLRRVPEEYLAYVRVRPLGDLVAKEWIIP
mmetsp:Transcript_39581/g.126321  ORF Transcript_39581/g.126321 Transcript_39581/m.126321 type:complete len:211 (-) Transcript_39581:507-1139(-)